VLQTGSIFRLGPFRLFSSSARGLESGFTRGLPTAPRWVRTPVAGRAGASDNEAGVWYASSATTG
jgi:hypothetical protein